jgi:hypothetical protein
MTIRKVYLNYNEKKHNFECYCHFDKGEIALVNQVLKLLIKGISPSSK